jgi:hypothetical protein
MIVLGTLAPKQTCARWGPVGDVKTYLRQMGARRGNLPTAAKTGFTDSALRQIGDYFEKKISK